MISIIDKPLNLLCLIIGAWLSIKLTILLFTRLSTKENSNKYLGAFVLVLSLTFITGLLYRFHLLEYFPHIIGLQGFSRVLLGPLAFLYVRSCTERNFKMTPLLWMHFLPFAIDVIFSIPFFMQSGAEKLEFYYNFVDHGEISGSKLLNIIKIIYNVTYFMMCIPLIRNYGRNIFNEASYIDVAYERWLNLFIFLIAFPYVGLISFYLTQYNRNVTITVSVLVMTAFLLAVDLALSIKPELFKRFPHQLLAPDSETSKKQKYERSNLAVSTKENYLQVLLDHIEKQKSFLKPELTIAQLSKETGISVHYISQVINEKLDCNFLDFINGYRVELAMKKLKDPELSNLTIMGIAYDSGFNYKSTFYKAFKKHTGKTPSAYRAN